MSLMKAIGENPFRTLGLSVRATDRQVAKRVNELSTLYEFGKQREYITDFPFVPDLRRSPESIQKAASQIELPGQKLFHATFWFWDGNSIDELVYEMLRDGAVEKAAALWERQERNNGSSKKNYSNCKNLALLNLILALEGKAPDHDRLALSINQFMAFFAHDEYAAFCLEVSGQTHIANATSARKMFVDELARHLNLSDDDPDAEATREFVSSFGETSKEIQSYVKGIFVEAPVHRIERRLSDASDSREGHPETAIESARDLHAAVLKDLGFLEVVLTKHDPRYQSLADRVANELLQASTAYYNATHESQSSLKAIGGAGEITALARSIAVGQAAKNRVLIDLEQINKIRDGAKLEPLGQELFEIIGVLPMSDPASAHQMRGLPATLNSVLSRSRIILEKMKGIVGGDNANYIAYSSLLANVCLSCCVKYANETKKFAPLLPIMAQLNALNTEPEVRSRLRENTAILSGNAKQENAGGCFVATWAFGDYDAPEVLVLRTFRDDFLAASFVGRAFISTYYRISPALVRTLGDRRYLKRAARYSLSKLIKALI
jgi:hypothetical protein